MECIGHSIRPDRPSGLSSGFGNPAVDPHRRNVAKFGYRVRALHDPIGEPGTIADLARNKMLVVNCGEAALSIINIQAPGSRAMLVHDFLNGYELEVGERFE